MNRLAQFAKTRDFSFFILLLAVLSSFTVATGQSKSDPLFLSQLAELTASDGQANDGLGFSVSVNGNTVVAGVPSAATGGNSGQGAAYVFVKPSAGWASETQTAKLTASDGVAGDQFGWSVAIQGNTVIVGAPKNCALGVPGKAYVFVKPNSGWTDMTQTAELTAADGLCFGSAVAIDGNTAVVGAYNTSTSLQDAGAGYVFVRPTSGWTNMTQTAKLTASDAVAGADLGYSISISGTTVVAAAPYAGTNGQMGKIYVYEQPTGGWVNATENAQLSALGSMAMGLSAAVSGTTVVAGDPASTNGSAYVYVEPAGGWVTTSSYNAELTASDGAAHNQFGGSVSASGTHIVIGAITAKSKGVAYLYTKPAGGWVTTSHFTSEFHGVDSIPGGRFARSVSINGMTIVAGADGQTIGGNLGQGAAYVF